MAKMITRALVGLVLLHLLAMAGLLGYGLVTGRFNSENMKQYLATWKGETLVPPPEELEVGVEEESPADAADRIAAMEIDAEMLSRELRRQIDTLRQMKFTVDTAQRGLTKDRGQFEAEQQAFTAKVDEAKLRQQDAGFQLALKTYSGLNAKYVKNDFMAMADEKMARLLSAMKPKVAKKILEKFKTPEEEQKRQRVMQLFEQQDVVADAGP